MITELDTAIYRLQGIVIDRLEPAREFSGFSRAIDSSTIKTLIDRCDENGIYFEEKIQARAQVTRIEYIEEGEINERSKLLDLTWNEYVQIGRPIKIEEIAQRSYKKVSE